MLALLMFALVSEPAVGMLITGVGIVALLALFGVVATGGGSKPLRMLDKNCELVPGPSNDAEAEDLAHRFQDAGIAAGNAIGGADALGDTPGDPIRNEDFARAWATEMLFRLAPECMAKLGVEPGFAANTNEFGADFSEYEGPTPPPAVFSAWEALITAIRLELSMRGYDLEAQTIAAIESEHPLGDSLVEYLSRQRAAFSTAQRPPPVRAVRVAGPAVRRGRWETMR